MSRLVYRAMLRLTAPDEYRRLYGRDDTHFEIEVVGMFRAERK